MTRTLGLKKAALALMLTAVAIVAVRAQIPQEPRTTRPGHCTGGPFTLTAGKALFHVALADRREGAAMNVTLLLHDSEGTIVARQAVQLPAGHTTTLEYEGTGLLRGTAIFDSSRTFSHLRAAVASVEVFDVDGFRIVIPVQCTPNENIAR